jgi:hypothetical protein
MTTRQHDNIDNMTILNSASKRQAVKQQSKPSKHPRRKETIDYYRTIITALIVREIGPKVRNGNQMFI